jgi:hypothetical protein
MKIQSVSNYDCQRKKDVNFESLLMKGNAFELVDAFFPRALSSVADGTWGLKPCQHKEFDALFLTQQESQEASLIGCGNGGTNGVYDYFTKLKEKAMTSGTYTVSRIREAIRDGTFHGDANFADFKPVANLHAKVEKHCSIGGKIRRGLLRVASEVINRKIVPDELA